VVTLHEHQGTGSAFPRNIMAAAAPLSFPVQFCCLDEKERTEEKRCATWGTREVNPCLRPSPVETVFFLVLFLLSFGCRHHSVFCSDTSMGRIFYLGPSAQFVSRMGCGAHRACGCGACAVDLCQSAMRGGPGMRVQRRARRIVNATWRDSVPPFDRPSLIQPSSRSVLLSPARDGAVGCHGRWE
jgi:hypothetical protein